MKKFFILTVVFLINSIHSYGIQQEHEIFEAIESGKIRTVTTILQKDPKKYVEIKGNFEQTPLMHAVLHNRIEMVRLFLDHNANVDAKDIGGATALHIAARIGNIEMVKLLKENRANPYSEDKLKYTSVSRAINADKKNGATIVAILKSK